VQHDILLTKAEILSIVKWMEKAVELSAGEAAARSTAQQRREEKKHLNRP
jgi:hypothetical protein